MIYIGQTSCIKDNLFQGWQTYDTNALARCIHCCTNLYISFAQLTFVYCEEQVYIYSYIWLCTDCIWITAATKQHCNETFYTNRSGAKCWLDIYHWGGGAAWRSVLQLSYETGSSINPSFFEICRQLQHEPPKNFRQPWSIVTFITNACRNSGLQIWQQGTSV